MPVITIKNNKQNINSVVCALPDKDVILSLNKNNDFEFTFKKININLYEKVENQMIKKFVEEVKKIKNYQPKNGKRYYENLRIENKVLNRAKKAIKREGFKAFYKEFCPEENKISEKFINKIISGDCLSVLNKIPNNSIDAIITSPPYNFGIDYSSHNDSQKWKDYFKKLNKVFIECVRVLKHGGRIIVNVQPLYSDNIPTHAIISNMLFKLGLIWKTEIIWEKNNYNSAYTAWGSWKSCSNPYLKTTWEYIEVYCKGSLKKRKVSYESDITADEFKKLTIAKWSIAPERNMKKYGNPAMFPEKLVYNCIKLFTYPNDIVLDPFNGAGTTTYVAFKNKRRYIGIDIDKKYCDVAKNRIAGKYEKK